MEQQGPRGEGEGRRAIEPVRLSLARVRTVARAMLLCAAVSLLLGTALAAATAVGLADFVLRMPAWMRGILLAAGAVGVGWGVITLIVPALRFRPRLTEIALRIERSEQAHRAGLAGVLASGLELADHERSADELERSLGREVASSAGARFAGIRAAAILAPARTARTVTWLAAVVVALTALWTTRPELTVIGAQRVLAPWSGAEWPKRTALADATTAEVHPDDETLPLRVLVTRTPRAEGEATVAARYRVIGADGAGTAQRVLMRSQLRREAAPSGDAEGELFERLIEPDARELTKNGAPAWVEYWFESGDARTEPRRVLLARRPSVESARATVTPPPYAAGSTGVLAGEVGLGRGADERAVLGPVLAGSRIELEVTLNKPVPTPSGWTGGGPSRVIRTSREMSQTERIPVAVVDEHGLTSGDDTVFTFEVVADAAPSAVVTEPARDEAVLATAVVGVTGEGRDDVGVAWAALEHQRARPPAGSVGAPPEPDGETVRAAFIAWESALPREARVEATLDLSTLGLRPGDELWITALAADAYEAAGAARPPTRSSPRRLRIISEAELMEQIRAELGALRRAAIQLDAEQAAAQRQTDSLGPTEDALRRQASLPDRIAAQRRTVDTVARRVERNALDDPALAGMLDDADGLLADASAAARSAAERIDAERQRLDAERERGQTPEPDPTAMDAVADEQARVREDLAHLIEMLDRGEDAWVARRTLERLLADQRQLMERTRLLGEMTIGREADELTPQERSELERIVEAQREAAQRAQQAIDELTERAAQLERADPAQAQAMRDAAERGRQEQVPERLDRAADEAAQNRMQTAAEQQRQAVEALERMLDDFENAQRNRDEVLRRVLSSVIESLEALIVGQQRELAALEAAMDTGSFDRLGAGMLTLYLNTLSVLDQVVSAPEDLSGVAAHLEDAIAAQESANAALRSDPPDADSARESEERSLQSLRDAKAEAERLDREAAERDAARVRNELRAAYRELLEQQAALLAETEPFLGHELTRRDRARVRGIGERQDAVRSRLVEIRDGTEGMGDTVLFEYAHTRLESATSAAAATLRAGEADRTVVRNQTTAVRLLRSLVEALDDAAQEGDFREQEAGGGDGGGQSGSPPLIPSLAELRLLRHMQEEAADLTRELDAESRPEPGEKARLAELQRELAVRGEALIERVSRQVLPPPEPEEEP